MKIFVTENTFCCSDHWTHESPQPPILQNLRTNVILPPKKKEKKSFKATTVWVRDGLRQRHLGGVIMLTLIFITIDLSLRLSVSGWAWIRVELNQLGNTILVVWSGAGATSSRWWSDGLASLLALSLSLSLSLSLFGCVSPKKHLKVNEM